jgi:hypothetical protein
MVLRIYLIFLFAPIDQIDNQILNPQSEFNNNNFDITIVFVKNII